MSSAISRLLPALAQRAFSSAETAWILAAPPQEQAERFYRINGWEEIGRQDNGEIIFRKAL